MIYKTHNRLLDKLHLERLKRKLLSAYDLEVSERQILNIGKKILDIEDRSIGRFAGHLEDYILLYYATFVHFSKPENRGTAVIEIGTLFGCSTVLIWHAIKGAKSQSTIYAVDPLEGYYGVSEGEKGEVRPKDVVTGLEIDEATVRKNLKNFGIPKADCELITDVSQSEEVIERLKDLDATFLFVDGDHTRSGVFLDMQNYLRLLKASSTVVIDNFVDPDWIEVTEEIVGGRYFDAGLSPLAFEKRLLVCEKSRRLRNTSVLSDICEGLLELISGKERSRTALRNSLLREEKRFQSLAGEHGNEVKTLADKSLHEISKLKGVVDAIGNTLAKQTDKDRNDTAKDLEGLAKALESIDHKLEDLGQSLEDSLRSLQSDEVKRIEGLASSLKAVDSQLTEINEIYEKSAKKYHDAEVEAIDQLGSSLSDTLKSGSDNSVTRFNTIDSQLTEINEIYEKSAKKYHDAEVEAIDQLGSSLSDTLKSGSDNSVTRFNTIKSSFTSLRKHFSELNAELKDTSNELHQNELTAMAELQKSLVKQILSVSDSSTAGFEALAGSLDQLEKAQASYAKTAKDVHEEDLRSLEEVRALMLDIANRSEDFIKSIASSLSEFEKIFTTWGKKSDLNFKEVDAKVQAVQKAVEGNHEKEMTILTEVKEAIDDKEKAEERWAATNEQLSQVQEELKQLRSKFEVTAEQLREKELDCLDSKTKVGELKSHLDTTSKSLEDCNDHLRDMQAKLGSLSEQNGNLNEDLRLTQIELTDTRGKLGNLISDHEKAQQLITEQEQQLSDSKQLHIQITHKEEALTNELIRLASKRLITKKDKESIRNII